MVEYELKLCSIFQQQLVDAFVHCAVVYYIMHTSFKFSCALFFCVDRIWNEICKIYVNWIANIRKLNELNHVQFNQFHTRQMWYSNSVQSMPNMVLDYSNEVGPTCNLNERRKKNLFGLHRICVEENMNWDWVHWSPALNFMILGECLGDGDSGAFERTLNICAAQARVSALSISNWTIEQCQHTEKLEVENCRWLSFYIVIMMLWADERSSSAVRSLDIDRKT